MTARPKAPSRGTEKACDVHAVIEVRYLPELWIPVAIPPCHRNYDLFACLAGVRGTHTPWFEPRGLPPDFHNHPYLHPQGHHETWFLMSEVTSFGEPRTWGTDAKRLWGRWRGYLDFVYRDYSKELHLTKDRVRVVMNFDG